jgi:hypothetical protein
MIRMVAGESIRCGLEAVAAWPFSLSPQPFIRKDMRVKITRAKRAVNINRLLKKMFVDLMVFITAAAPVFFLDPLGGESRQKSSG